MKDILGLRSRRPYVRPISVVVASVGLVVCLGGTSLSAVHPATATGSLAAILSACQTTNPYLGVARFSSGVGVLFGRPVVVAVHDTDSLDQHRDELDQVVLAQHAQVGAVNGIGYDWLRQQVYAAAYHRVVSDFGPGGPGAIYQLDLATDQIRLFANLAAGSDHHGEPPREAPGRAWVGRSGLGDIDVDDSATMLFATNLEDRRIYRVTLPGGDVIGSFPNGADASPWAANARPFGLGYRDGWLYHGVVDSRENPALPGMLAAYVYRSRPDGSDMQEVLSIDLGYARAVPWRAWSDPADGADLVLGQPYVADIEFRTNGDLIIGMADRARDMSEFVPAVGAVLLARRVGAERWAVRNEEANYYADPVEDSQAALGALTALPGVDVVVSTAAFRGASGGLVWYDNSTGRRAGPTDGYEWLYGDEEPIGDIEVLCQHGPRRTYLPALVRGTCLDRGPVDIVLVLDTSSSMDRPMIDGKTKIKAALEAAGGLIARLAAGDRVAIIGFNDRAWAETPLGDLNAARSALGRLSAQVAEGTRLDLALQTASAVSAGRGTGSDDHRLVAVLLTDGLPNHVPPAEDGRVETTVLRAAAGLKASGAKLYTIGLGVPGDFSPELLRAIASDPALFQSASSAEGLRALFVNVATGVGCR